jgi:hypothetical protein
VALLLYLHSARVTYLRVIIFSCVLLLQGVYLLRQQKEVRFAARRPTPEIARREAVMIIHTLCAAVAVAQVIGESKELTAAASVSAHADASAAVLLYQDARRILWSMES